MLPARHVVSVLLGIAIGGAGPAKAAGLLDGLLSVWGGDPPPRYQPAPPPARSYYRYEDLEPVDDDPPRGVLCRAPREDLAPVNTVIDPVKVPDWFLTDPTLRRGDIVVLARGVFVFEGTRSLRGPADFVPLEQSRLSAAEKDRVAAMTGYRPGAQPPAGRVEASAIGR